MPSINQYYQNESEYLKAADLMPGKKFNMTITGNSITEFEDNGIKKRKIVLHFSQTDKKLTLNKTNGTAIAHVYGDEVDNWAGKNIFIFSVKVSFADKMVDAIRIEMPLAEGHMQENVTVNATTPVSDFAQPPQSSQASPSPTGEMNIDDGTNNDDIPF